MEALKQRMRNKLNHMKNLHRESVESRIEKEDSLHKGSRYEGSRNSLSPEPRMAVEDEGTWDEFSFGTQADATERDHLFDSCLMKGSVQSYESQPKPMGARKPSFGNEVRSERLGGNFKKKYMSEAPLIKENGVRPRKNVYNQTAEFNEVVFEEGDKFMTGYDSGRKEFRDRGKMVMQKPPSSERFSEQTLQSRNVSSSNLETETIDLLEVEEEVGMHRLPEPMSMRVDQRESNRLMKSKYNTAGSYEQNRMVSINQFNKENRHNFGDESMCYESSQMDSERYYGPRAVVQNKRELKETQSEHPLKPREFKGRKNMQSMGRLQNAQNGGDKENNSGLVNRKSRKSFRRNNSGAHFQSHNRENVTNPHYRRELLILSKKIEEMNKKASVNFGKLSDNYDKLLKEYEPYTQQEEEQLSGELLNDIDEIVNKVFSKKRSKLKINLTTL
jgi:hypothetical protein